MKEQTKKWLIFVEEDLKTAEVLFVEGIYNQVCFHSQQCVEKLLKALIEEKGKNFKEHRLIKLYKECKNLGYDLAEFRDKLDFLDKFYTSTRYPFIIGMLPSGQSSKKDAETALEFVAEIYSFATNALLK